jgi:hypothetical protein
MLSKRSKEDRPKLTEFDRARNELLSQIRHCGVLEATADQRDVWFKQTMEYLTKRYPAVSQEQLDELDAMGRRYCEPIIAYGAPNESAEKGSN